MEKIRQDFFSWLPTSNEVNPSGSYGAPEATYDAPAPAYETPAAYEAPAPAYVSPVYDAPEEPEPYQPPTYPKQGTVEKLDPGGLVVSMSACHAKGPGFDPTRLHDLS